MTAEIEVSITADNGDTWEARVTGRIVTVSRNGEYAFNAKWDGTTFEQHNNRPHLAHLYTPVYIPEHIQESLEREIWAAENGRCAVCGLLTGDAPQNIPDDCRCSQTVAGRGAS